MMYARGPRLSNSVGYQMAAPWFFVSVMLPKIKKSTVIGKIPSLNFYSSRSALEMGMIFKHTFSFYGLVGAGTGGSYFFSISLLISVSLLTCLNIIDLLMKWSAPIGTHACDCHVVQKQRLSS